MAKFRKAQYVRLTEALRRAFVSTQKAAEGNGNFGQSWGVLTAAEFVADALERDNPAFDKELFLKGVKHG